jgi:hypothetical protein
MLRELKCLLRFLNGLLQQQNRVLREPKPMLR